MDTESNTTQELLVFVSGRAGECSDCGRKLMKGDLVTLSPRIEGFFERKAICMACSDLDHLVFLPSGDAALTRRAKANSTLSAVVLKWSKSRKRNERQGLVVEEEALSRAEMQCLEDADVRERHRERAAIRAAARDAEYVEAFALAVRQRYPGRPEGREIEIAEHACQKYSGRVGRTAAAKDLDASMVDLAVYAHVRHRETEYDRLLNAGVDRHEARDRVRRDIERVLEQWRTER